MLKICLPLLFGGVGAGLILSLYLLNDYHRAQLALHLSAPYQKIEPRNQEENGKEKSDEVDLTNGTFFIIFPRLRKIFFLPNKHKYIKVTQQGLSEKKKEVWINSYTIHKELRYVFRMLFTQSIFIIGIFSIILFFLIRNFFAVPLSRLVDNINRFRENPEAMLGVVRNKKDNPLSEAESALTEMQDNIKRKFQEKSRLEGVGLATNKISHDLRNILSNAQLLSDSLRQEASQKQKQKFRRLSTSLNRAIALCMQYLNYTRFDKPQAEKHSFAFLPLAKEVKQEVCAQYQRCAWRFDIPKPLKLYSDSNFLFRILFNLSKNAAEAGASKLTLSAQQDKEKVQIILEDNGKGLPLRVRGNLFMPFVNSGDRGYGLGLSIAQELARALNGELSLLDTDKTGTRFCLTLPNISPNA